MRLLAAVYKDGRGSAQNISYQGTTWFPFLVTVTVLCVQYVQMAQLPALPFRHSFTFSDVAARPPKWAERCADWWVIQLEKIKRWERYQAEREIRSNSPIKKYSLRPGSHRSGSTITNEFKKNHKTANKKHAPIVIAHICRQQIRKKKKNPHLYPHDNPRKSIMEKILTYANAVVLKS